MTVGITWIDTDGTKYQQIAGNYVCPICGKQAQCYPAFRAGDDFLLKLCDGRIVHC